MPPDKRVSFGNSLAWGFWTMLDELKSDELQFALRVAANVCEASGAAGVDYATLADYPATLACCCFLNGTRPAARRTSE